MIPPTERIEVRALDDLYQAGPAQVASAHGIVSRTIGGAICTAVRAYPESRMLNRVTGLGLATEATEQVLDEIDDFFRQAETPYFVALSPDARPPHLSSWLHERGFARDYAWAKFWRPVTDPPRFETDLRVERIESRHGTSFGRVVVQAYEFPPFLVEWIARLAALPAWDCYVAFAGDEPAATGALYVADGVGWLSFAATLPQYRRRGAQNALLSTRIARAADLGCRLLVTETGDNVDGRPSNSYRNILRSGFQVAYVRPNYRSRR